jgi:transposase-like protein
MHKDLTHDPNWTPPHCPNPGCPYHMPQNGHWPYRRAGFFRRQVAPHIIRRYRCLACRRGFSNQTFSTTYWLKRPDLLAEIYNHTNGAMANRQLARPKRCAPGTVDRQLGRLGRHCLLFQRHFLQQASPFADIAIDGISCFEYSQYHPFEHLHAVDNNSSFIIHFNDAPLRRSGRMTDHQKKRRQEFEDLYGRPDPKAVQKAARELLETALQGAERAIVRSDEHQAYVRALRGLGCQVDHRQTSSRRRRDRRNELFEVNLLDMFLRHSSANHRRETIAFSKRRQESAYRLAVFTVWKNFEKRRWEKRCWQTPAMILGLTDRVLTADDVLGQRLFPAHHTLPPSWERYYWRDVETPALGRNGRHRLKYAF